MTIQILCACGDSANLNKCENYWLAKKQFWIFQLIIFDKKTE